MTILYSGDDLYGVFHEVTSLHDDKLRELAGQVPLLQTDLSGMNYLASKADHFDDIIFRAPDYRVIILEVGNLDNVHLSRKDVAFLSSCGIDMRRDYGGFFMYI